MDRAPTLYTLYDPEVRADPHSFYHHCRSISPVVRDSIFGHWLVTGYTETAAGLRDQRLSAKRMLPSDALPPDDVHALRPIVDLSAAQMLFLDPPDHGRVRSVVAKAFTPKRAEVMRQKITAIVEELIAPLAEGAELDLVSQVAYPLPAIVIAEMLGVPAEDRDLFKIWCDDFIRFVGTTALSGNELLRAAASASAMTEYFRDLVTARRLCPHDDLLTDLIRAQDEGRVVSEHEFLANCILLLTAGHETSTHMLGNAVLALLEHPAQREIFTHEPEGVAAAINELLRYDGPVQFIARTAKEDLALGDAVIRRDERVLLMLAAANRDPRAFPEPDTLDLRRGGERVLAFGHGVHVCLGAPLARLEAEVGLTVLLQRFPHLHKTSTADKWQSTITFRGLAELRLRA
ncbi:MAG: cytochrome P450 [Chloroflexota bacterium]